MTHAAPNVLPFRPRPPAPSSELDLVSRLLELARAFDDAGRPHVAGLLVGAAYTMCDSDPPPDGGGRRRAA